MNFIRKIILVAFCIFFIVCTYLLVNGYSLYKSVLKETPLEEKIRDKRKRYEKMAERSIESCNKIQNMI